MGGQARREHSRFLFRFHPKLRYILATFRFDLRHIHFGWQFPGIDSPMSKQEEKEEELEVVRVCNIVLLQQKYHKPVPHLQGCLDTDLRSS